MKTKIITDEISLIVEHNSPLRLKVGDIIQISIPESESEFILFIQYPQQRFNDQKNNEIQNKNK